MTPQLEALFATSLRIREYQAAARTIEALAHLASDPQVKATLRQQVAELDETAEGWRRRQEADLIETIPSAVTQAVEARDPTALERFNALPLEERKGISEKASAHPVRAVVVLGEAQYGQDFAAHTNPAPVVENCTFENCTIEVRKP